MILAMTFNYALQQTHTPSGVCVAGHGRWAAEMKNY